MTTISQERAKLAEVGLRLRRREEWGSSFYYGNSRSVTSPADYQFVHITVTNASAYSSDDAHARAIEAIGRSRFPNTGGSYNRLAMQSGRIYELQPVGRRGAHTVNDKKLSRCSTSSCPTQGGSLYAPSYNLNHNARAYAIAQNVRDEVTAEQLDNLARVMAADRLAGFVKRDAGLHGHRCVAWKDCPGGRMWSLMHELERKINHYVKAGVGGTLPDTGEDEMTPEDKKWLENLLEKQEQRQVVAVKQGLAQAFEESSKRNTTYGRHLGTNLKTTLVKAGLDTATAAKVAAIEIKNPVTGEMFPLDVAMWSIWNSAFLAGVYAAKGGELPARFQSMDAEVAEVAAEVTDAESA